MTSRALIAGLGSIGRRHLRLLREALPEADIRVLRHSGCEEQIDDANGCFTTLDQAVAFAPNLAIIASPAPYHLGTAMALARAGAHLLVEKPISHSAEKVCDLISLCNAEALVLQIGYNLRFLESLQVFRAEIAAERIGTVHSVHSEIGQYLPSWRRDVDYRETVSANKALGGGVLLELSHEIDMLRWVFGEVDWLAAWTGRQSALEIDVEDCAMLQLGFAAGQVAQLGMDFLRHDTTRTCIAIGATGSLRWDALSGTVEHFDPHFGTWAEVTRNNTDRDHSYRVQIAEFLAAVAGRPGDIAAKGADGLAVMHLIEVARQSDAAFGRRIKLGETS